jgi:ATP-dependent helicase/nuclease subunit A
MTDRIARAAIVPLTEEQRRALAVSGASVALSAGAGCGKTTVLAERFLSALDAGDGRPLRALVALTFTEKAGRELRQRIRTRGRASLALGVDLARWQNLLRALGAAPVGTFHEFCAQLLRRHASSARIDPEFVVLDEAIAATLREDAVRSALRHMLASQDPDLINVATDYGLRQVREALERLTIGRATRALAAWSRLSPETVVEKWRGTIGARLSTALRDEVGPDVTRCRALLESIDTEVPRINERATTLRDRLHVLGSGETPCAPALLDELVALLRVSDLPKKSSWPSERVYDEVKEAFERLREQIKQIRPALEWDDASVRAAAMRSLEFARLAVAVDREYESAKTRRRGLDFDDLLVKARDLLRDHPAVLSSGREAGVSDFEFVLVDEFQDTDGVQSEILRLLCGSEFDSGRLFVVGDVKQSIYRFRGAEPSIFRQWRAEFPAAGRLRLTENFRSVPGIIQFVNALFGDCFLGHEPLAGPDDPGDRLLPVRTEDTALPAVEFLWPDIAEPGDKVEQPPEAHAAREENTRPAAADRRAIEARCVARRLRERLDAGWTILDRGTGALRAAHPGDVALLFRAMTDVWRYEQALAELGFDYHTIGGSAFYAQQEVHDVINLLSVVEDPFDEIALAGALRSPFFSVSDEGLFWLATSFKEGGLTTGLERLDEIEHLSERDRKRARRAMDLLSRWRSLKDRLPMAQLVALFLDESGFEAATVCESLGERKLANTRKLVRLARAFDRQGGFTLADFVARLLSDLENQPREEQAATTDEAGTSIRLMTIHQAKGLEFPIVVLPDLARKAPNQSPLAVFDRELGLMVRPPRPASATAARDEASETEVQSIPWRAYRWLERAEDEKESLRLFYVAATRARDSLMLSAGLGPDEPVSSSSAAMRLLDERFDRRTGCCRDPLEHAGALPEVHVRIMNPPPPDQKRPLATARFSFAQLADLIDRAMVAEQPEPARPTVPMLFLDLDPAACLPPRAARLDRLIRAILRDHRGVCGEPLEHVVERAGARQTPAASAGLIREAVLRIRPWRDSRAFRDLCSSDPQTVHHDVAYTISCPVERERDTVIRGTCDVVYADRRGHWQILLVADACVPRERERLRLLLAGLALPARGFGPIVRGCLIQHGPGGEMSDETVTTFDSAAVAAALAEPELFRGSDAS